MLLSNIVSLDKPWVTVILSAFTDHGKEIGYEISPVLYRDDSRNGDFYIFARLYRVRFRFNFKMSPHELASRIYLSSPSNNEGGVLVGTIGFDRLTGDNGVPIELNFNALDILKIGEK